MIAVLELGFIYVVYKKLKFILYIIPMINDEYRNYFIKIQFNTINNYKSNLYLVI
jgi:hypothetical protein